MKWAGGKEQELKYILPLIPPFEHYYEPFVGGGAVFFSVQANKRFINDKSPELFNLYMMIAQQNETFFQTLEALLCGWWRLSSIVDDGAEDIIAIYKAYSTDEASLEESVSKFLRLLSSHDEEFKRMGRTLFESHVDNFTRELQRNVLNKTRRMKALENKKWKLPEQDILANIESALKSAFYMHIRHLYNNIRHYDMVPGLSSALFFFVRENAFASMFRYNRKGAFNVPYGGISYNRKDLKRKVDYMHSQELSTYLDQTVIENMDFEAFLTKYPPQTNDFIFLDPPYDSQFSTYAQNEFTPQDQRRLAHYLKNHCSARFMLVIKSTPAISNLYAEAGFTITSFGKKYLVSFQDRNDRSVEHLLITNY